MSAGTTATGYGRHSFGAVPTDTVAIPVIDGEVAEPFDDRTQELPIWEGKPPARTTYVRSTWRDRVAFRLWRLTHSQMVAEARDGYGLGVVIGMVLVAVVVAVVTRGHYFDGWNYVVVPVNTDAIP